MVLKVRGQVDHWGPGELRKALKRCDFKLDLEARIYISTM